MIKATGFFRTKARALIDASSRLVERHHGEVPASLDDLVDLPGVGRKTANVVLGHALGVPGLPVDRHVFRVANRIGIARAKAPEEVEQQLTAALPRERWTFASDSLILHGRRVCRPRPLCPRCALSDLCLFYRSGAAPGPAARAPRPASSVRGRKTAGASAARRVRPGAATGAGRNPAVSRGAGSRPGRAGGRKPGRPKRRG